MNINRRMGGSHESKKHLYCDSFVAACFGSFIRSFHQADKVPKKCQVGSFHPFYRPRKPLGRVEVQLYSVFRPRHQKGVRAQRHAPAAFYPREKNRYPLYRRLCGPQGRSGRRKISPHRDSIAGSSSPQPVTIPTELHGPQKCYHLADKSNQVYSSAQCICFSSLHVSGNHVPIVSGNYFIYATLVYVTLYRWRLVCWLE